MVVMLRWESSEPSGTKINVFEFNSVVQNSKLSLITKSLHEVEVPRHAL